MKTIALLLLLAGTVAAQTPTPAGSAPSATPMTTTAAGPVSLQPTLQQIEQTAQSANLDLARLRIDKWKADSDIKEQAQANADSISRNLTAALPSLIAAVRAAPQNLAANFKLYRNLNALYDVFEGLAESAGAFGGKHEFEALRQQVADLDAYRRTLGDYVEMLAASKDAELARAHSRAPAPAVRPRKIIVDNEPAPRSSKKKK